MADEYIRREDALKGKKTGTFANGICLVAEPCVTVEYIESLEPADVVPVRLGGWLDGYKMQTCSLCKCRGKKSWTFCPHCGAKMDGGKS